MEKISITGKNLVICIIPEENSKPADWSSFSTWYSTKKILQDAYFACFVPKRISSEITFSWLDRCQVKRINVPTSKKPLEIKKEFLNESHKPTLFLKPEAIMTRSFYEEEISELNSGFNLVGNYGCESIALNESTKHVDWLSSVKLNDNPVFLCTLNKTAGIDMKVWASQSRDPIFTANWNPSTIEEKLVQENWKKMHSYYSMVV